MAKKLTLDLVLRHIGARIQKLEWEIERGEPYHATDAAKEEMENLQKWIEHRLIWKPARDRDEKAARKTLGLL